MVSSKQEMKKRNKEEQQRKVTISIHNEDEKPRTKSYKQIVYHYISP